MQIIFLILTTVIVTPAQEQISDFPNAKIRYSLPAEMESKRFSIPGYYQRFLSTNKQAFEPKVTVQDTGFQLIGHWAWGPCYALDVNGNYAYVASGPTLLILDISNPADPQLVTEYKTQPDASGNVNDIKVRDSLLYLLDGFSLQVLDIRNPVEPQLLGILYSSVTDKLVLHDTLAFILHMNNGGIKIVHIKNPYAPVIVRSGGGIGFGAMGMSNKGGVAYLGSFEIDSDGLHIFDYRNLDSISLTFFNTAGWVTETFVKDTLLFVGVDSRPNQHVRIYSIADPIVPVFLGEVFIGRGYPDYLVFGMHAIDSVLFAGTVGRGIFKIDITDPANPAVIDSVKRSVFYQGTSYNIAASNNHLFSSTITGMWSVSALPNDSLRSVGFFAAGGELFDIAIRDSLAYVADYNGIGILNILNPQKPYRISEVEAPGTSLRLKLFNNYIFLSLGLSGMALFDISNPSTPVFISHYSNIFPADMVVTDSILFVLNSNGVPENDSLIVFEKKINSNITRIGGYSLPSGGGTNNTRLALQDNILYIAKEDSGVLMFNVGDPMNPQFLTKNNTTAAALQIKDTLLYVLGNGFLSVFDLSDPTSLILKSKIATNGYYPTPLIFDNNFLYYKSYWEVLSIDLANPYSPANKGSYKLIDGGYNGLNTYRSFVFTTDITKGLKVLQNDFITKTEERIEFIPTVFHLSQNYPNPFNPTTTISFSLPRSGFVSLKVYDMLGKEIATVANDNLSAGEYRYPFNGISLASGIYCYRLQTDNYTVAKKMLLLK